MAGQQLSSDLRPRCGSIHLALVFFDIVFVVSDQTEDHRMDTSGKPSTAQFLLLATSSALTAVFYSVYRRRTTTVARLKVITLQPCLIYLIYLISLNLLVACLVVRLNIGKQHIEGSLKCFVCNLPEHTTAPRNPM